MKIIELETVGSTNDYAKDLARKGASANTVVWAHEQTAGKGRQGNQWVSKPGNLFMTVILKPKTDVANIGQLSLLSAVALASIIETLLPSAKVNVKWPNDILINGKKAAGILMETESGAGWVVLGIGLNITSAPEGAICLSDLGIKCPLDEALQLIIRELERQIGGWEKAGFKPVREAWLKRAWNLGKVITARMPKETLKGVFEGIDATGALQLKMPDGALKTMNSGEVFI